jgi:glycosyltransferase involved in cell wall biosynthesis
VERYAEYGVAAERVLVAPPPVDPVFHPDPDGTAAALERLMVAQPYVVTLGGAPRRQLPVAVAAWERALGRLGIEPRELPLVVLSGEVPDPRDGVVYAGALDDEDMARVFAGARAFCYATSYEGFGMPALEAAAAGVPVVCARVGALPEVLGDAAAWSEDPETEPLGEALAGVLGDPSRARDLIDAGLARARRSPGAAEVAEVMVRSYREAQVA